MPEEVGRYLSTDGVKVVPHAEIVREVNHQLIELLLERLVMMCIGFEEASDGVRADGVAVVNGLPDDFVSIGVTGVGVVAASMELAPDLLIQVDDGGLVPVERGFWGFQDVLNCILI